MSAERCPYLASLIGAAALALAAPAGAHPSIDEHERHVQAELAQHPEDPDWHISIGRVSFEKNEWDSALASYATARRLGADDERIALLEGTTYLEAGWPRMAKERFEAILAKTPTDPAAHLGRGRAWMNLEHPEKAAADYAIVVETISSLQPGYVLEYREALLRAGRRSEAVEALDAGIARLGQVPALQLAAIDTQVEAENYDDALRRLDLLLATSPDHPQWSARRGEILERAGRTDEARLAYVNALHNIQTRTSGRRARRLDQLEDQVRAALARSTETQETKP